MATERVKENVSNRDGPDKRGIEPEKHAHVVGRPKVVRDPPDKAAVEQRFVEDVHDVRRKKCPEEKTKVRHDSSFLNVPRGRF